MAAVLQIVGLVAVAAAVAAWSIPAGLLTAGVFCVVVGIAIESRGDAP